ncbi:hypothetical protein [Streptomyces gardneri]|uniref:Uncharacterized protein n=1 Tax=Streptomyces gardneri TaxID=66892 RepID=A0A4Y3RXT9_9ACTN|nr:hypothetical protein [Streptomyces gardneri]GEB62225.1 hypothetical protein SGA01_78300 [Streptomyces gardneri]
MTYVVTVEIRIPEGAPELDGLHRVGATALLEQGFASVAGIEGADGMEMDLFDVAVAVHPGGAILKVMVAAPSLEFAEEAVGSVSEEVLERSELLAEWTVESSEVQLHTDAARESLEAADGPGAPPSDPQARRAHHTAKPDTADETEQETQDHEAAFRTLAARLRSFGPAAFGVAETGTETGTGTGAGPEAGPGPDVRPEPGGDERPRAADAPPVITPESAELAAGSLVYGAEVLIDELYDDVQALAEEDTTVAECQGHLWHLDQLPSRHAQQYNELFARRFLVTAIALTTRFTDGSFRRLGCLAEELVLKLLLEQAHVTLDLHGLLDEDVAAALGRFAGEVYEDMDFAWLQDTGEEGADGRGGGGAALGFGTWFTPFDDARYVHPYALDEIPETGVPDTAEN